MPARLRALALLAALQVVAARAAAQGLITLARGVGELGAELEGLRNQTGAEPAGAARDVRGWLAVPLAGALAEGRLLTWTLTLRPTVQQRTQPGFGDALTARQMDLSFGARLLGARPVSLSFDGLRATGTSAGGYGSRREFATRQLGATLWWRNPVFPAELEVRRRDLDDEWITTPGAARLRTAYTQREVRFAARSSKTTVHWQQGTYDDRASGNDLAYHQAQVLHAARWGRGSRLETSWRDDAQRGPLAAARRQWAERLHLQHAARVSSDHFLERSTIRLRDQDTRALGWGSGVTARLGRGTSAHLAVARYAARTGPARLATLSVTPRLGVATGLPGGWRASAGAALGFERRSAAGAAEPVLVVADEPHQVPPGRSFTLTEPYVETGSIVVRSADRAVVYAEGADYVVVTAGNATRVDVTPGGRIEPAQTVLVSYRHRVPAPRRSDATRMEFDLALERRGVALRHHTSARRARGDAGSVLAGVAGYDESRTDLDARRRTPLGELGLEAGMRRWARGGATASEWQAGAGLSPPPLGPVNLSHALSWSRAATGGEAVTATTVTSSASWSVAAGLTARGSLEALWWRRAGAPSQRYVSATIGADWRVGTMEIGARAEVHRRSYVTRSGDSRLALRMVRRF